MFMLEENQCRLHIKLLRTKQLGCLDVYTGRNTMYILYSRDQNILGFLIIFSGKNFNAHNKKLRSIHLGCLHV